MDLEAGDATSEQARRSLESCRFHFRNAVWFLGKGSEWSLCFFFGGGAPKSGYA